MNYTLIDLNTYPRKEHWDYYQNKLQVGYSITVKLDVTNIIQYKKERNIKFYPIMIYCISKVINSMDCMKMMKDKDGNPGIWDVVHPNFTIFHKDDCTFSDIWMEYKEDFNDFIQEYNFVIKTYGDNKGIKARDNQPANFYCVSGTPWLHFEAYTSRTPYADALFPIISYGKYIEENGKYLLPLTLTISHAAADGYHSSLFFNKLQKCLSELK